MSDTANPPVLSAEQLQQIRDRTDYWGQLDADDARALLRHISQVDDAYAHAIEQLAAAEDRARELEQRPQKDAAALIAIARITAKFYTYGTDRRAARYRARAGAVILDIHTITTNALAGRATEVAP